MCNYLNKYTNLNDAHYIRYASLYEICTKNVFLICLVYFQNCAAIKKKVTLVSKHPLVQISLYPWINGQYMLPY